MAFFGLVSLLHRVCLGSSPSDLGDGRSVLPWRHANAPVPARAHGASSSGDDMACAEGVSNVAPVSAGDQTPVCGWATRTDRWRKPIAGPTTRCSRERAPRILPLSIAKSSCRAGRAGAILSGPSAPETFVGDPRQHPSDDGRESSGWTQTGVDNASRPLRQPLIFGTGPSYLINPILSRSDRTNGREASLASRSR